MDTNERSTLKRGHQRAQHAKAWTPTKGRATPILSFDKALDEAKQRGWTAVDGKRGRSAINAADHGVKREAPLAETRLKDYVGGLFLKPFGWRKP